MSFRRLASTVVALQQHQRQLALLLGVKSFSSSLSDFLLDIASEEQLNNNQGEDGFVAGKSWLLKRDDRDFSPRVIPSGRTKFVKEIRTCTSSLPFVLSNIRSEPHARRAFAKEIRIIANVLTLPHWNPSFPRTLVHLGISLTPPHVKELIRAISEPVWALRVYIWASSQPGYQHDSSTRGIIVAKWVQNEAIEPFLDVLDGISSQPCLFMTLDSYLTLIKGYCWAKMPDAASKVLHHMHCDGLTPNLCHFNAIISAFVQTNCGTSVQQLYEQMQVDGIMPNSVTCGLVVCGHCRAGHVDEGLNSFIQMLKRGFTPEPQILGELMDCMCKANKVHWVYILIVKMHEQRYSPDVSIFHAILKGFCRNGCTNDAVRLVKKFSRKGVQPSEAVCNMLVAGFCKERKILEAWIYIKYMLKKKFLPEPAVFNLFLIVLFKEENLCDIFLSVDKVMKKGFAPDASSYNILIHGLSKYGEVEKALEVWNILSEVRMPSQKAYRALMQGLYRKGRLSDAVRVLRTTLLKGGAVDMYSNDVLLCRLKEVGRITQFEECDNVLRSRLERRNDRFEGVDAERAQYSSSKAEASKSVADDICPYAEESSSSDD